MKEINIFRTITLDYPIKDGEGKDITELHLRRAKAKDLREAQTPRTEADQEFYLIGILTGLVIEDVAELDIADYQKVQTVLKEMQKGKSGSNS